MNIAKIKWLWYLYCKHREPGVLLISKGCLFMKNDGCFYVQLNSVAYIQFKNEKFCTIVAKLATLAKTTSEISH